MQSGLPDNDEALCHVNSACSAERPIVPFGDRMKKAAGARGDLGARRSASEAEAKLSRAAPVPDEPAAAILLRAVPNGRAGRRIGRRLCSLDWATPKSGRHARGIPSPLRPSIFLMGRHILIQLHEGHKIGASSMLKYIKALSKFGIFGSGSDRISRFLNCGAALQGYSPFRNILAKAGFKQVRLGYHSAQG